MEEINTKVFEINTQVPEEEKIQQAAEILKAGGLVAFPTETVYGLGACALDEKAVDKIFIAKGRPADNPLIVHISNLHQLDLLVKEIPQNAKILMDKFWPGPLTIIFKKKKEISKNVTAGLNSIAVRMPSNKIALALIEKSGPLAAPSANLSGKPSPTTARDVVWDLNGRVEGIIDGGDCEIGLESTVLNLTGKPEILRPGKITYDQLKEILKEIKIYEPSDTKKPKSSGVKYKHYCPQAKVILIGGKNSNYLISKIKQEYEQKDMKVAVFSENDKEVFAKDLFKKFHDFDRECFDVILVKAVDEAGLGSAIMNRLRKAASEIVS